MKTLLLLSLLVLADEDPSSIRAFKLSLGTGGTNRVRGYVTRVFECPPCPAEALCGPCPPDGVMLSDRKDSKCPQVRKDCEDSLGIPTRDQNVLKRVKLGEMYDFIVNVSVNGYAFEETKVSKETQDLLKKDPGLLEKNPAQWLQKNYKNP